MKYSKVTRALFKLSLSEGEFEAHFVENVRTRELCFHTLFWERRILRIYCLVCIASIERNSDWPIAHRSQNCIGDLWSRFIGPAFFDYVLLNHVGDNLLCTLLKMIREWTWAFDYVCDNLIHMELVLYTQTLAPVSATTVFKILLMITCALKFFAFLGEKMSIWVSVACCIRWCGRDLLHLILLSVLETWICCVCLINVSA